MTSGPQAPTIATRFLRSILVLGGLALVVLIAAVRFSIGEGDEGGT